jgi:hypothetical protein
MTRDDLADRLHHLDPGATLSVEPGVLAEAFGSGSLTQEIIEAIEAFALEHRCMFIPDAQGGHVPTFEKDDVY